MPTALIGPEPLRRKPGPYKDFLEAAGFDLVWPDGEACLSEQQLREWLPRTDVHMAGGERITAELMDLSKRLKVIARTGVGYDAIDIPAASARNIVVCIVPGTNQESVAEQAFALLLAAARNVVNNDASTRAGGFDRTLVRPLRGQTLGLVGLGRIGRAVATRAIAFGMKVVAYEPMPAAEFEARHGIARVGFDELLGISDVVSLHLPLSESTRGLFDRRVFEKMKPNALFINTSRGGLVVEKDLHEFLDSGRLAGAGLDVFEQEPPSADNPLFRLKNVVVSPHIAGIDTKSMEDMANLAAKCMVDVWRGEWPGECVVNREIEATWRRG